MRLDNQLIIETPERVELRFALANIGSRFFAALIDHLLQLVVLLLLLVSVNTLRVFVEQLELIRAVGLSRSIELWLLALFVLVSFVIHFGYFAVFEAWWNGQTPGKRWLRLRVIRIDGRPIGFFEALVRNVLRSIDFLPSGYALGVMSIMLHREARRLGDLVAGTVVVKERLGTTPSLEHVLRSHAADIQLRPQATAYDVGNIRALTTDDVAAVERFLLRRSTLPEKLRPWIATRIADSLSRRLGVSPPPTPESFLEAVDQQYRAQAKYLVD
ncbi:MAG: RDD family protein [Chloracidobacterium sp.]|uniref:RDD family protein n=1 Tax=Chloracidobacterium validum TaxID=2821543 RepID=A0ABX8B7D5_9BACT|nr:RDD family protein [Chloracidobacterium validum]QUW02858.1 RDD family protein [Chloracidobacterium validum]